MKKVFFVFLVAATILSCNDNDESKAAVSVQVKQMSSPASNSCAEPFLFTDRNDVAYLSWIEKKGKQSTLFFSTLSNEKWSESKKIASGINWFVNWADYPVISVNGDGNLLAHFLEKSDTAKFAYDVKIISSADSGKTWSQPKILNEDNVKAEHGFVSIMPYKEGFLPHGLMGGRR